MRRLLLLTLLVLLLGSGGMAADREDLYLALDRERAHGDLEGALDLFQKAARSGDARVSMEARLGEGRCLRRLKRWEEAREALDRLIEDGPPPDLLAAAERERSRVARSLGAGPQGEADRLRDELARAREDAAELREALDRERAEEETESLKEALREKDRQVEALTARLTAITDARKEQERERALRAQLAAHAIAQARWAKREERYDEAREWLEKALTQDPLNDEAREMLSQLGDPLGDRDRLIHEVLKLLDFERRIRLSEIRLEVDALLSSGQESLIQGNLEAAASRFRTCIALVDRDPTLAEDLASRRAQAEEFLQRAVTRGAAPDPAAGATPAPPEAKWRETLRALLREVATSRRPGGRRLRIHDVPDVSSSPRADARSTGGIAPAKGPEEPGELYAALIPALVDPRAFDEGRHVLQRQGSALVVHATEGAQKQIASILERVEAGQDPPARIEITVLAVDPARLGQAARSAGATFTGLEGAAFAVLDDKEAREFSDALGGETLGRLETESTSGVPLGAEQMRSLNLITPPSPASAAGVRRLRYGLALSLLPLSTGNRTGLAVSIEVSLVAAALTVPAEGGDMQIPSLSREKVSVASEVPDGGTLAIVGLQNPFAPGPIAMRSGLVLLVKAEMGATSGEAAAVAPLPVPAPSGPEKIDLAGLDPSVPDAPAPAFRGESARGAESRTSFVLRYLRDAIGEEALRRPDSSLAMGRDALRVTGDEELVRRARDAVTRLRAGDGRLVGLRVRAARLSSAEESTLLRGLSPGGRVLRGEGVRLFVLSGGERSRVGFRVTGSEGRIPILNEGCAARSLQLVNLGRVIRHPYLAEYREGEDGSAWPVFAAVDEGLSVDLRPVVLPDGRVDLDLTARVARILDRGEEAETDRPAPRVPVLAISEARAAAVLTAEQSLLLSGLPAPTPVAERRDRLVLLVDAAVVGR